MLSSSPRTPVRSGLRLAGALSILSALLVLGCSTPEPQGPTLSGYVLSGSEPLEKLQVAIFEAGSKDPLGKGISQSDGSFSFGYAEPSSSDAILFVLADRPFDSGMLTLMTVFDLRSDPSQVVINELTTVASAYALAQFINANNVVAAATPGLRTAVGMGHHFFEVETGDLGQVIQNGTNSVTSVIPTLNSLANMIAACIDDAIDRNGDTCDQLFELTDAGSPNTLQSLLGIVLDPSNEATDLFALSEKASSYGPALEAAPAAWTLALRFLGVPETMDGPGNLAIDAEGSIWVANNYEYSDQPGVSVCAGKQLLRFTSTGEGYPGSPYEGGGIEGAGFGIGIAPDGDVWVGNFGFKGFGCDDVPASDSVSRFGPDGVPRSLENGIQADGKISWPQGTVPDQEGNIWIANCGDDSVAVLWEGKVEGASHLTDLGIEKPFDIAHNSKGQAFVTGNKSGTLAVIEPDGTPASNSPIDGKLFDLPMGVAVDSQDNVWVASSQAVHVPCPEGFLQKSSGGHLTLIRADGSIESPLVGGGLTIPWGITIDGNDNVWVANFAKQRLSHFCGAPETGCPRGKTAGEAISPEDTGYWFDGLSRVTGLIVDASGNVWLVNNWKNDAKDQKNPGGYELVAFIGIAEPVARPTRVTGDG